MKKLLLSLLLSQAVVTGLKAEAFDQVDQGIDRDLISTIETENPTTADNPNPYVTGNIAQLNFQIDATSALGKKIVALLNFCAELTSHGDTEDAAMIADLTSRFNALTDKEKQFVQVVITSTSALRVATEELVAQYESTEEQA